MIGFLNINKPSGVTSNYIVCGVKRKLKIKKVGHFGTLDPLASGVLPVAIGKATKLFGYFLDKHKIYVATFQFGYETDTLDSQGQIIYTTKNIPSNQQIQDALKSFVGKQNQIPPSYSAKNINGVRAYELARKGEEFTLASKEIEIFEAKLIQKVDDSTYQIYIHCSSGTYIRSIARDLGRMLGSYATMTALIREKSGIFDITNSISPDADYTGNIISVEQVLPELERVDIPDSFYKKLLNGVPIEYPLKQNEFILYCKNELFGIAEQKDGLIKIKVNLKEADL